MIIKLLRRNIGTIVAMIGMVILAIITFGDLGEIASEQYWENVKNNLTAIGFMSVGLVIIQVVVKWGVGEQALQCGLNTEQTKQKYDEHKELIRQCTDKMIYLPYFLRIYNDRHTELRKREFLVNNNFSAEQTLYASKKRRLIWEYRRIRVNHTTMSIKWATTEISHDKHGRIASLNEYRRKRFFSTMFASLMFMVAMAFLTKGLFFTPSGEPFWQKLVKLLTYFLAIAIGSITTIVKDFEKGAYSVPNELDEINEIWQEFKDWSIPQWVKDEVERMNNRSSKTEVCDGEKGKTAVDSRTDLQVEQKESENIPSAFPDSVVSVPAVIGDIRNNGI